MSHTPDGQVPDETMPLTSPAQFKALSHPLRQRLLLALGRGSATISQLSVALGSQKGNVAHHLKVLREAGMVRVVETRQVRGGTEQYYGRTARRMVVAGWEAAPTTALFGAVAEELARSPQEPLLTIRQLRLGPEQAARLRATLEELVDGADDLPPGEALGPEAGAEAGYGLLVALYQQADPAGPI